MKDKSLYGRRPEKEDEISVGKTLAEEYGLHVGETMELFINGEKKVTENSEIICSYWRMGRINGIMQKN